MVLKFLAFQVRRPRQADRLQGRGERGRQRKAHSRAQRRDQQVEGSAQDGGNRGRGR